jgi:hypothetical protein
MRSFIWNYKFIIYKKFVPDGLFSVNHCSLNKTVINIITINVCCLKRRIQYPEFLELVNDNDILFFVETKTDDVNEINLPGFIVHPRTFIRSRG